MFQWFYVTKAQYDSAKTAGTLVADHLYFISDTKELFKGEEQFNEQVRFYTGNKPTIAAQGVVYLDSATLAGSVWNGTAWKDIIAPVTNAVDASDEVSPVTGKAVSDYVAQQIGTSADVVKDVTYDTDAVALTVTKGNNDVSTVALPNVAIKLTYNEGTGEIQLLGKEDAVLSTFNIELERFIKSAVYDAENYQIILTFNDSTDPLTIGVKDLVDIYDVASSENITMSMSSDSNGHHITASVKVRSANNILHTGADGLYVEPVDLSAKMDLVDSNKTDEILIADSSGQATASGLKAGNESLGTSATTLATEAAVSTAISNAVSTVNTDIRNDVVAKTAVVTTISDTAPSTTDVASEAAVVEALSWKTSI